MDVYTFNENEEHQQAIELRKYYHSKEAEISPEPSAKGIEDDMHKIIAVCDITFSQDDVTEADIEGTLNSIVSVLMVMPTTEKTEALIVAFCEKLTKAPSYRNLGSAALRVLYVLFQAMTTDKVCMKYHIYLAMVQVSGKIGEIAAVYACMPSLKAAMASDAALQRPSTEQTQQLLRTLHQTLLDNRMSDEASSVMLELLASYSTENASQARDDAHRCIIACIGDPNTYIMDHLLSLKPVKFLDGELVHDLLEVFVRGGIEDYIDFYQNHKDFVSSLELSHEANLRKMRVLTLLSLAQESEEMTYQALSQALRIEEGEVEAFIIEALRTKLLVARMDQKARTARITRAEHRTFGQPQWEYIASVLQGWGQSVALVRDQMHATATAIVGGQ